MWFEIYREPRTIDECLEDMSRYGPEMALLAGGTDLVPQLKDRRRATKTLINLMSVEGLAGIDRAVDGSITIGAMTTLRGLLDCDLLGGALAGVRQGIASVSSAQVRNVATLGGNTCNASPAADTVPGLIAAGAEVGVAGMGGRRWVSLETFLLGPGKTALGPGDLLTDFRIPPQPPRTGSCYKKHAIRGNSDVSIVGIGVRLSLGDDDVAQSARVVLGAVAPTAIRSPRAERALVGRVVDADAIEEASALAADDCRPISDVRASARYRTAMVKVFTRQAVREAALRALGRTGGE